MRTVLCLCILQAATWATATDSPSQEKSSTVAAKQSVQCSVDLSESGQMSDILSNALLSLDQFEEASVSDFLDKAAEESANGQELLKASAVKFKMDEAKLQALVEKFKHCNCKHTADAESMKLVAVATGTVDPRTSRQKFVLSQFAEDVVMHVVLHEMGHALVREFDLPVLSNEETLADAFATVYLTNHMPDRAAAVLEARVTSLMIEAKEVARNEWTVTGEHNSDARRAYQIAALAVAADAAKYKAVAAAAGMTESDINRARDYGTEIHRSWRRILKPLRMPEGMRSNEARVTVGSGFELGRQLASRPLVKELDTALRSFDWHSSVKIAFVQGDGGAGWSRSRRTITVNSAYVERFIRQGSQVSSGK
ncbi:MAG: DUF4344 domain-containing metallopeptidase [Planctomycetaceae bacterium]